MWNLRVVIGFHLSIDSVVILPSPVAHLSSPFSAFVPVTCTLSRIVFKLCFLEIGFFVLPLFLGILHLFVRSCVAVSKAKFAENLHFVLSRPDEIAFILTPFVFLLVFKCVFQRQGDDKLVGGECRVLPYGTVISYIIYI